MIIWAALLAAGGAQAGEAPRTWRQEATAGDRERLRGWRDGWRRALAEANRGDGAAVIAADPALFDPDDALDRPGLPAGNYRCRTVSFVGGHLTASGAGRCRVGEGTGVEHLAQIDGGHRFDGAIYADTSHRLIFLGTLAFADERRPSRYGHAAGRDMAGIVERIGDRRWRLVLPAPHYESQFDIVDLEPAG